jgi:hypothetical protein
MFKRTTTLSTVSRNTLGLILAIVAANAMAEEYFTINDGQLERPTGYREGTILMKELVSVGSKAAVSGNGYFQGDFIGLEATIKSKKHFPDEPGNWAYYSFSTPDLKTLATEAKAFSAESCNGCHAGAASVIFVGLSMSVIAAEESFSPYVGEQGNISFPDGLRTSMVHLGSWFVPEGGASGQLRNRQSQAMVCDDQRRERTL